VDLCNLSYNFAEMVTFAAMFSFIGECNCFTALKGAMASGINSPLRTITRTIAIVYVYHLIETIIYFIK